MSEILLTHVLQPESRWCVASQNLSFFLIIVNRPQQISPQKVEENPSQASLRYTVPGDTWRYMYVYIYTWIYLDVPGYTWIATCLGIPGTLKPIFCRETVMIAARTNASVKRHCVSPCVGGSALAPLISRIKKDHDMRESLIQNSK